VQRYLGKKAITSRHVIWRFNNKVRTMPARRTLRVETLAKALVHWSVDNWQTARDTATDDTTLGVHVVDLPTTRLGRGDRVDFTFYWPDVERWEGTDFFVCVESWPMPPHVRRTSW
jgi:glucoamylase